MAELPPRDSSFSERLPWERWLSRCRADGVFVTLHAPVDPRGGDRFGIERLLNPGFDAYVGIATCDADCLPPGWAEACNGMDEIWVPSTFDRETFAREGVDPDRLQVIPLGLEVRNYDPHRIDRMEIPGQRGFTFLSILEPTGGQGRDLLLDSYFAAFTADDDVCLVLGSPGREEEPPFAEQIEAFLQQRRLDPGLVPDLILLDDPVPDPQLPQLYAACDAFVQPVPVGAWALRSMEAMAMGLPVIAPCPGGHVDFMDDENAYLIEGPGDSVAPYAEHLRRVFEAREEAKQTGARARQTILEDRTSDRTAAWVACRVAELLVRKRSHPVRGLRWDASLYAFSGYARLSKDVLCRMEGKGLPIAVRSFSYEPEFLRLLAHEGEMLHRFQRMQEARVAGGTYVCFHPPTLRDGTDVFGLYRQAHPGHDAYVGLTMFESDRLPAGWAEACNGMDEVWVPSTFNRETFIASGVDPSKIQVIPFGIDAASYDPDRVVPMPIPGRKRFAFLSVFQWTKRKGWDVLLLAYLSAFSAADDVCLVLRTYPDAVKTPPIAERIAAFLGERGIAPERAPAIVLLDAFLPDERMPALYAACDAFVLPTRGEGWGIPYMEAMAAGLPVIATRWSAHLDFMDDETAYLIDVEGLAPVDADQTADNPFYIPDQRWAEPSVAHTAALLRQVFERQGEARAKGRRAREHVREHWSLERTADWITAQVGRHRQAATRRAP